MPGTEEDMEQLWLRRRNTDLQGQIPWESLGLWPMGCVTSRNLTYSICTMGLITSTFAEKGVTHELNKSSSCYFLFLVDCLASFVSLFSQCKFELSKTPKFYHARSYLYPLHISLAFTFHTTLLLLTCFLASSSPGK